MTYQITAPHFVAGFERDDETGVVTNSAPIISYMRSWSYDRIVTYCVKKDWRLETVISDSGREKQ